MDPQTEQDEKVLSPELANPPEKSAKDERDIKSVRHRLINWGLIMTVLALGLSVFQAWQSIQAGQQIQRISESVSTQYVDTFPKNIPAINKLIKNTESSLLIVTDFPAYGNVYHHEAFREYRIQLQTLALPSKKIKIELLTYDESSRGNELKKHFDHKPIDELKKAALFSRMGEQNRPGTHQRAYEMIEERNKKFLEELTEQNVKVTETSNSLPVFVWIRDGREAIFSFYSHGNCPQEVSFHTSDPRLIGVLTTIARGAFPRNENAPAPTPCPGGVIAQN